MHQPEVAVIGGGVAGLVCARALEAEGRSVAVFDKGRRPGGRTCSRHRGNTSFDHGAQYFTVRDPRFANIVRALEKRGVVAKWSVPCGVGREGVIAPDDHPADRWVGMPTMSRMAAALAEGLTVRSGVRVGAIERGGRGWQVRDEHGSILGSHRRVVLAVPAPQALSLLRGTPLETQLRTVTMAPCWAAMITFDEPVSTPL